MARSSTFRQRLRRVLAPIPGAVPAVRLVAESFRVSYRYRVTGLAAEAAFFALLSLPPLLLTLVAGAGFIAQWLGPETLQQISDAIQNWSLTFLTPETVEQVIMPTLDQTLRVRRADVLSIGFVVALWSGSRVIHVFLDAVAVMYGQGGARNIVKARLLSLLVYAVSILGMGITLPLLLIGPDVLHQWLPEALDPVTVAYWPIVGLVGIASLAALFHLATPNRSPYRRDVPGALVTVLIWALSSFVIRSWALDLTGSLSVFGPLTAPIVLMVYLYFIAFAVLVGAATNAAVRRLWPPPEYRGPIVAASEWWDERRAKRRRRALVVEEGHAMVPSDGDAPTDPSESRERSGSS